MNVYQRPSNEEVHMFLSTMAQTTGALPINPECSSFMDCTGHGSTESVRMGYNCYINQKIVIDFVIPGSSVCLGETLSCDVIVNGQALSECNPLLCEYDCEGEILQTIYCVYDAPCEDINTVSLQCSNGGFSDCAMR
ncbi:MAG: hypothetical protein Q8Q33_08455 [Chlamydiota bacterium]|nr:hypothetical protein [Chlamydiota bacterium]